MFDEDSITWILIYPSFNCRNYLYYLICCSPKEGQDLFMNVKQISKFRSLENFKKYIFFKRFHW